MRERVDKGAAANGEYKLVTGKLSLLSGLASALGRQWAMLTGVLGLVWALFALILLITSFSERQSLFQQLVESQQETIASGQFRPFIEGIERLSNGRFKGTRICWSSEPCKVEEFPSTDFLWIRTSAPVFGGDTQLATVWTYVSVRRPIGEALAGLLLVLVSAIVFAYGLASLRRRFFDAQYALTAWTKNLVSADSKTETGGIPVELAPLASAFRQAVVQLKKTEFEKANAIATFRIATQVAHDIRSPLAALNAAEADLRLLPEDARLLVMGAVSRISGIANHLLEVNRGADESLSLEGVAVQPLFIACLIEEIVAEKRLEFKGRSEIQIRADLDSQSYGLCVVAETREFKRVLSNLINNAVDALEGKGLVTIRASFASDGKAAILIEDDGKGISDEVLAKLGKRGGSFDKEGGSGLGLHHARESLAKWQGLLQLQSALGKGTVATIILPRSGAPSWSIDSINLYSNSTLVVIDDDATIHGIWNRRAITYGLIDRGIGLSNFYSPQDFRNWKKLSDASRRNLYLFDYEFFGSPESGLDVIEELNIADKSILVTSHYEDRTVRLRCHNIGVPIIPKRIACLVPINFLKS